MGVPLVGKGYQRKIRSKEIANRRHQRISHRIRSASGGGCSSANHQRSLSTQRPSQNDSQHTLGALQVRGTSSERSVYPGCVHDRGEEMDSSSLGPSSAGRSKNRRGGTLAAWDRSGKRDQGQDQDTSCRPCFHMQFVGNFAATIQSRRESRSGAEEAWSERRSARQCQTEKAPLVLSPEQVKPGLAELQFRDQLLVFSSGHSVRAGRGRSTSLDGLRFRQRQSFNVQHSYYWDTADASEGNQNGGLGKAIADASGAEKRACWSGEHSPCTQPKRISYFRRYATREKSRSTSVQC